MKKPKNISQFRPEEAVCALVVSSRDQDVAFLRVIFGELNWTLYEAASVSDALMLMKRRCPDIVISDRDLVDGTWRRLLDAFRSVPEPPPLIVTSRLADEYLWAEVLNEGGFDVLAQPLDREETVRVASAAIRRCRNEMWRSRQRPPVLRAGA